MGSRDKIVFLDRRVDLDAASARRQGARRNRNRLLNGSRQQGVVLRDVLGQASLELENVKFGLLDLFLQHDPLLLELLVLLQELVLHLDLLLLIAMTGKLAVAIHKFLDLLNRFRSVTYRYKN
jgi:hypothetical protein